MTGWGDGNGGAISGVRAGLAWCGLAWCGVARIALAWIGLGSGWGAGGTIVEPHGKAA